MVGSCTHGLCGREYHTDCLHPIVISKGLNVSCFVIVVMADLQEASERIKLPFAVECLLWVVGRVDLVAVICSVDLLGDL